MITVENVLEYELFRFEAKNFFLSYLESAPTIGRWKMLHEVVFGVFPGVFV